LDLKNEAVHDNVRFGYEKDYLLAEQGNDAPKAPHLKSLEAVNTLPVDNQASATVCCRFRKW
jgi:hypothetical protein